MRKSRAAAPQREIWKEFSGDKAFAHVTNLVAIGPRPSGSQALEQSRAYITDTLAGYGWRVERQSFTARTPRGPVEFVNLIARFSADSSAQTLLVLTHYDTKIFDTIRFVGANDGGSGTGALLELSRVLALDPALADKVELVFFDGEEAVNQFDDSDGLYGSRHFARMLAASPRLRQFKRGILWDMIGDKDLGITLPSDSPPEMARGILQSAEKLGLRKYFSFFGGGITDDHVPLNEIGIPTIDLIDFDYSSWHTAGDTPDKLSPDSMKKVAAVTLHYLRQELVR